MALLLSLAALVLFQKRPDALNLVPIVTYTVESNNIPAIRVLEKLGFRFCLAFLYAEVERRKA